MAGGVESDGNHGEDGEEEECDGVEQPTLISEMYMAGFVIGNIVGLRHYSGRINGREMVGLVREPLNPYDSNSIKVLNTRSVQVGNIERATAAVLAPLIDSCLIIVEAIVPKPPRRQNPYSLPCQIHVFARMESIDVVRMMVNQSGLTLIQGHNHMFGLSESVVVAEEIGKRKLGDERSMDEIFALVGKGERKNVAVAEVEPPKDVIVTELFLHQKEGLGWLVGRENGDDLPPFWERKKGVGFLNVLTNHLTTTRPEQLRGGIFADEMGLGKTLTLLSLIATNRATAAASSPEDPPEDDVMTRSSGSKRAKKRKMNNGGVHDASSCSWYEERKSISTTTTLVVCPPSVFSTWITQLEEHTAPGSLKVYLYHGERTRKASELLKYHIVLTTYSILSLELNSGDSPIKEIDWFRVILDEAHLIKNSGAQQTKACISLKSDRRWVVTGTPIQNNSFDLFSLMAFLKFEPFSIKSYWQSLVQRPLDQGNKSGMSRLQALIGMISLRRTKDSQADRKSLIGLPPKSVETCYVELSSEERERYDEFESEARSAVGDYISSDTIMHNYSSVLLIILRLRQICNDMSLCPGDIKSMLPAETLEDASNDPELLKKLVAMVQDGEDFDCPICLCPPERTIITSCTHIFCKTCIMKTMKQSNAPRCPICRRSMTKADIFLAPPPPPPTEEDEDSGGEGNLTTTTTASSNRPVSSKVSTLLKLLKEQNPTTKSVVFSQFGKMLDLLEYPLRAAGFAVARLDGSMSMKKRSKVIKEFGSSAPSAPTILLASLRAAGVGINLTAASRVYFVDPWWNPAVEEQAMDRVHRIGQRNEVKVVRLIVKRSIEEKILELQERKKKLTTGAFAGGRASSQEEKRIRVEDLRTIMGL